MHQLIKPPASPECWSFQFTDGDPECMQCRFKDSCRPAAMNRHTAPPTIPVPPIPRPPIPIQQTIPLPTRPFAPAAPTVSYAPPYAPPYAQPGPVYRQPVPPPPVQHYQPPQQTVQYQQPQYSIPDPRNPHPAVPMMRPGAQGPAYYFTQYPNETIPKRLGKNMLLRAGEGIFQELMYFFRHWTWPPRS